METVILRRGHGYDNPTMGDREPCKAFDGFEVIANPLGEFSAADRERRVLGRVDDKLGTGCDYGSHAIKLAVREGGRTYKGSRELFILMQHGGGRVVYVVKQMYDGGATERALLALPDAALYGVLYTMVEMVETADRAAREETRADWKQAHADKRIRQRSYPKRGRMAVWIEPKRRDGESEESHELRKLLAAPSKV